MNARQRARLRRFVKRVVASGREGVETRGCASERLVRRAVREAGLVACVAKSRPWMPRGRDRVLCVFATLDLALSRFPRWAVMR